MTMIEGSGDDDVLDGVFDRETPQETVVDTENTEAARARDEKGRFAPKSEPEPQAQAQAEPEPTPQLSSTEDPRSGHMVPVAELTGTRTKLQGRITELERLHIEAEARAKAYEQMLQRQPQQPQYQPQQFQTEAPDFYTDPEAALNHRIQPVQKSIMDMFLNNSENLARDRHGDEVVDAALQAANAVGAGREFVNTRHPYGELVKWHKRQQTLQVVGDDPDAYRTKIEAEVRAKVLAELKAGGAGAAAQPRIPGTLATATGQGEQGAHLTEEAAMGSIFSSARNRKQG